MTNLNFQKENSLDRKVEGIVDQSKSAGIAIEKMARDVGNNLGAKYVDISNKAREDIEMVKGYVKKNPGKSFAIATAVGALFGGLAAMIMRRKKSQVTH